MIANVVDSQDVDTLTTAVFARGQGMYWATCMCCGWPQLELYAGDELLDVVVVQHGEGLRSAKFSSRWYLGLFQYGYDDGWLDENASAVMKSFLAKYDVRYPEDQLEADDVGN